MGRRNEARMAWALWAVEWRARSNDLLCERTMELPVLQAAGRE